MCHRVEKLFLFQMEKEEDEKEKGGYIPSFQSENLSKSVLFETRRSCFPLKNSRSRNSNLFS